MGIGKRRVFTNGVLGFVITLVAISVFSPSSFAATPPPPDFNLLVSPSPLVSTIKPGQTTTLQLKIRNNGSGTESLKIETRRFSVDNKTGKVTLDDKKPSEIAQWISFSDPTFQIQSGQWENENVHITLPKDTGFSYSLALVISRTNNPTSVQNGRLLNGSLAVFTLLNVDRPGATRQLQVEKFSADKGLYEYLPATFNVTFKNTGNTIVQPEGNIFVQRGSDDKTPIATLPVNDANGYILPGSDRLLTASWSDGFPYYQVTTQADGSSKKSLTWNFSQLQHFRFGEYTAKLVAVYNNGYSDVPLQLDTTFWVIPWRAILLIIVVVAVVAFLRHKQIERKTRKAVKRALDERDKRKADDGQKTSK